MFVCRGGEMVANQNSSKRIKVKTLGLIFLAALLFAGLGIIAVTSFLKRDASSISITWQDFQQSRSAKSQIITALWADLGYGGMIHHFKNYLLRHDEVYYNSAQSKLEAIKGLISQYQSLDSNMKENQALVSIEQTVGRYEIALSTIKTLIADGKTTREIDKIVVIDDAPAIEALITLKQIYSDQSDGTSPLIERNKQLSEMRHVLGFDGLIHHFKNYILRKRQADAEKTENDLLRLNQVIKNMKGLNLNNTELMAIDYIEKLMNEYNSALIKTKEMTLSNATISEIDQASQVNDIYALNALTTLEREITTQIEEEAVKMSNTLNRFENIILMVSVFLPFFGVVFIGGIFWILKVRVIDPIGQISELTMQLAQGDLSINIDKNLIADDEVGKMANALVVFKNNAIERKEVENRLLKILEITPQAIIAIDKNFNIQMFNKGATNIFGYLEQQIKGQPLDLLIPERFHNKHYEHITNYMNTKNPRQLYMGQRGEILGRKKNGKEFPAIASISTVDHGGQSLYLVALVDITKQKKIERRLQKSIDQTKKANKAKSEFMASMSHELRTPLNSILGFSEVMSGEHMGPMGNYQYVEYAMNIHRSGQHLLEMVNDILDIERIESGTFGLKMQDIIVPNLLEECHRLLYQKADDKEITFSFKMKDRLPLLHADRHAIIQILLNLLSNAIKFTNSGGKVDLVVKATKFKYTFMVVDTGIGISPERLPHITDPFIRHESNPHKAQEGVGLSLAITNSLVKLHYGRMIIESALNVGTTVTVTLPNSN